MNISPSITSLATASPRHEYSAENLSEIGERWLGKQQEKRELFARLIKSIRLKRRHYVLPAEEILPLRGNKKRNEVFEVHAPELMAEACFAAMKSRHLMPTDIGTLVYTSCTVPSIPSIDGALVDVLGLKRTIRRIPIYQYGCAGGVAALGLASSLRIEAPVMLVSAELCSLVFHSEDLSNESLLSAVLFSDGAACAIVEKAFEGIQIEAAQSFLLPNSRHIMGYRLEDDGSHLLLDRALPQLVAAELPKIAQAFLEQQGITVSDINWWLFHPGGTRILQLLEEHLKLESAQSAWAWEVLSEDGNMSSATIFYVIERFLSQKGFKAGDRVVVAGIGPGLSVELLMLRCS